VKSYTEEIGSDGFLEVIVAITQATTAASLFMTVAIVGCSSSRSLEPAADYRPLVPAAPHEGSTTLIGAETPLNSVMAVAEMERLISERGEVRFITNDGQRLGMCGDRVWVFRAAGGITIEVYDYAPHQFDGSYAIGDAGVLRVAANPRRPSVVLVGRDEQSLYLVSVGEPEYGFPMRAVEK
jgi:hypothetical protein